MSLVAILTFGILILGLKTDAFNPATRITLLNDTTVHVVAGSDVILGWQYRLNTDAQETFELFYCGYFEKVDTVASGFANGALVPLVYKQKGKDFLPAYYHQPVGLDLPKASTSGFATRITAYQNPNTGACYMEIKQADQTMNDLKISCILKYGVGNPQSSNSYMGSPVEVKVDSSKLSLANALSGLKNIRIRTLAVIMSGGLFASFFMIFWLMCVTMAANRRTYRPLPSYDQEEVSDRDVEKKPSSGPVTKHEKSPTAKKKGGSENDSGIKSKTSTAQSAPPQKPLTKPLVSTPPPSPPPPTAPPPPPPPPPLPQTGTSKLKSSNLPSQSIATNPKVNTAQESTPSSSIPKTPTQPQPGQAAAQPSNQAQNPSKIPAAQKNRQTADNPTPNSASAAQKSAQVASSSAGVGKNGRTSK